jgi:hypothetical protein
MALTVVLRRLLVAGETAAWQALGFAVVGDRFAAGEVTVRLAGADAGSGLLGWELAPPAADVDGLPGAEVGTAVTGVHANGVTGVDHVVVGTPDVTRTTAALAAVGVEPRCTVEGARGDTGTLYRFFLLGTSVLELIGPAVPTGDGPARFAGVAFVAPTLDGLPVGFSPPRPAVQPGRQIATATREAGLGVPVAVLTPRR